MKTKTVRLASIFMLIGVLFAFLIPFIVSCNDSKIDQLARTKFQIINGTDSAVTVFVTLGATEGCLQNCDSIPYVTDSIAPLVGSFVLGAHDSTIVWSPDSLGFNGNVSFNTQPLNCATAQFPNGVNMFEFIINNSFQAGNPQETVDISCVAGTNCGIICELSGGNVWNAGPGFDSIQDFRNNIDGKNSGVVGVFPYGCDGCVDAINPPACDSISTDRQKFPICTVQRNAVNCGGGLVRVVYLGSLTPLK